jgi:cyanophycin synthetase
MRWEDARRITGRHPLLPVPGAGIELVATPDAIDAEVERVRVRTIEAWRLLGWPVPQVLVRTHQTGATLAADAPPDLLYTAADALEWAATAEPFPTETLLAQRDQEARPHLRAWLTEGLPAPVFYDDDAVTVGLGRHSRTWLNADLHQLDPEALFAGPDAPRAIPFVYVTGTNGKTTTTRLLARMAREAGHVAGHTSSDGVVIDGAWATHGDWTGPGAARAVLRHPDVDFAVLETARGGLMRRGVVLDGADGAIVTNVSDDHLGEWGLHTLDEMAWAKLVVAHAVRPGGVVVLHGRNAPLRAAAPALQAARPDLRVLWFAAEPGDDLDAWCDDGALWARLDGAPVRLVEAAEVPITMGGTAGHNVENALCAALLALNVGLPGEAVVRALRGFRPSLQESRGRLNRFRLASGGTAIVDFAHNPDAIRHLATIAASWRPGRVVMVTGQAGDRSDELLQRLAEALVTVRADHLVLKELPKYRRGREEGEVRAKLEAELVRLGQPPASIEHVPEELDAVRRAIGLTGTGDLALLVVHEDVEAVVGLLREVGAVEG